MATGRLAELLTFKIESLTRALEKWHASTPGRRAALAELEAAMSEPSPSPESLIYARQLYRQARYPSECALGSFAQLVPGALRMVEEMERADPSGQLGAHLTRQRYQGSVGRWTSTNAVDCARQLVDGLPPDLDRHATASIRGLIASAFAQLGVRDAHADRLLRDLDERSCVTQVARLRALAVEAELAHDAGLRELRREDEIVNAALVVLRDVGDLTGVARYA